MSAAKKRQPPLDKANPPKTLSPAEVAEYIGVSIDTYYRHIHPAVARRDILSMIIGRQRRVFTNSLDRWLEAQARDGWQ